VELAGTIAELARYTLARDFRTIRPETATVLLLEAGQRILPAFPESLARYAQRRLEKLGVAVRTRSPVEEVSATRITVAGEDLAVGFAIWAAGVRASPMGHLLGVNTDRAGRIAVNPDLSVPGLDRVFALGDLVLLADVQGRPLPGLAQVAKQQGQYLGRALVERIRLGKSSPPFRFHNRGNTAIIGRHAAVFDFGWGQFRGAPAWMLWALIHVYLLTGFQHRLLVAIQWLWRYLTYERGSRLIAAYPQPEHPQGGPHETSRE
jgi:NADH dehydrogenase